MLRVYVATGEKIAEPLKKLCQEKHIECRETKLHVGDIFIVRITESDKANEPQATNLENLSQTQTKILENLPQIQAELLEKHIEPLLLIERKTLIDFCQSLSTQHKKEQNLRLLQYQQNLIKDTESPAPLRIAFVIEGYLQLKDLGQSMIHGKSIHQLESAFAKLGLRDQIMVQHVYSLNDHIDWIRTCLGIFEREPTIITGARSLDQEYLTDGLKIQKKANLEAATIYLRQFNCIPGISMIMAQAIVKQYPSWPKLFEAWANSKQPEQLLAEIPVPATKPGVDGRCLGPRRSLKIYQAMNFQL